MRKARFSNAYTFQYSKRPGTPAAEMADQLPKEVVQERYMRLLAVQEEVNIEENRKLVGTEVELLVAAGEGRKNAATHRLSGRARDGRLVHFRPEGNLDGTIRPGDVVTVVVTHGAPITSWQMTECSHTVGPAPVIRSKRASHPRPRPSA